ncbi:MAG: DUF1761 domain-containing protein [Acidimicrobiales bacterium]
MPSADVNYLAVLAAAAATFALGALWYSPVLFAKAWMQAHGYSPEKLAAMQKRAGRAYAVSFACYLVMAFVLSLLVDFAGATTAVQGLWLGFLVWLGFAATLGLTAHMFSDKPLATYLIDAGYQLVYLIVMGVVLAVWR